MGELADALVAAEKRRYRRMFRGPDWRDDTFDEWSPDEALDYDYLESSCEMRVLRGAQKHFDRGDQQRRSFGAQ